MRDSLLNLLPWAVMFLSSIDIAYATRETRKILGYELPDQPFGCHVAHEDPLSVKRDNW